MTLAGALCVLVHTVVGFTNRSLCAQVSSLLGGPYTSTQTTYDLRRLRLKGLIRRLHGTNRYLLTPEGVRVTAFYTKIHHRLLEPLLDANQPPAPIELRRALRVIDNCGRSRKTRRPDHRFCTAVGCPGGGCWHGSQSSSGGVLLWLVC